MRKVGIFLAIVVSVLALDGGLKAYIHSAIPLIGTSVPFFPYGGIGVFHDWYGVNFSIVHVVNKGAAWGMLASLYQYLLAARIVIIGVLIGSLFFAKATGFRTLSFSLIIAGALGNVIDFFVYGHVIDMFYFTFGSYSYPVFNIADSAIFMGIALLVGKAAFSRRRLAA